MMETKKIVINNAISVVVGIIIGVLLFSGGFSFLADENPGAPFVIDLKVLFVPQILLVLLSIAIFYFRRPKVKYKERAKYYFLSSVCVIIAVSSFYAMLPAFILPYALFVMILVMVVLSGVAALLK